MSEANPPSEPDAVQPGEALPDVATPAPFDDSGLGDPVPITVWHVPKPSGPGAAMSAQISRRLVANYTSPGGAVVDLTSSRRADAVAERTSAALVITSWPLDGIAAPEHLRACAGRLRAGGCLAVVVTNSQIPDQLGPLVDAARAVGLTYLQHVVAAHHLTPRATPDAGRRGRPRLAAGERHLRVHTDVLVFVRPGGTCD